MKVILYMNMTVNGYIAKEGDEAIGSPEICQAYYEFVKKRGNIILGKRTYEIMKLVDEFKNLNYPMTVVVSSLVPPQQVSEKTIFVSSPLQAVKVLEEKGYQEIVLGGGALLNSSFLREGLIDEIYLDIEPLILGRGVKLFAETEVETKLELLGVKKLSKNIVRLHYKVVKEAPKY